MKLTELNKDLIKATNELNEFKSEAAKKESLLKDAVKAIKNEISLTSKGLDTDLIETASRAFRFEGDPGEVRHGSYSDQNRSHVRQKAISDAIEHLCNNPEWFDKQYIGVKNYSGFGDQREDHNNGYGPRHGSIVFSVRKRVDTPLTDEQIEAVIYYLHNWAEIKKSSVAA